MRSMPVEEDIFRRLFRPTPQKSVLARKTDSCGVKAPAAADPRAGRGTTDKARKYEVPSTRTSGSSDSRHRKVAASKAAQAAAAAAEAGSSIEVLDGRSTVVTDLARISHADTPRPTSSDSSLPPIGTKSRSRSLSPDTAAAIHAKFSRQKAAGVGGKKQAKPMVSQADRTNSGKSCVRTKSRVPICNVLGRRPGSSVPPSATDYDFLRRALSEEKQPFLPAPSLRRGRSNSLPCESADITSLSVHLKHLAEKSVSDEAIAQKSSDGSLSPEPSPPRDPPRSPSLHHRLPSPADLMHKTNEWVSSLPDCSPPPAPSPPPPEQASATPATSAFGVLLPRRKPDAFLENRRQSLNLVVVYGSEEEAEFKPTKTRDHFEKRRTDTFPFGRVFQALKLRLGSPSLVINETDIELEEQRH
jgi:hypothetical protein